MATRNRRAGIIYLRVDGEQYSAVGNFSYNLGAPKREGIPGADGMHGFMDRVQTPYIEGEITDSRDLDLETLLAIEEATCTLELGNRKQVVLREAWYAADGTGQTERGNIQFRMEGMSAEELGAS